MPGELPSPSAGLCPVPAARTPPVRSRISDLTGAASPRSHGWSLTRVNFAGASDRAPQGPGRLLFAHGPGGIGKTTLLLELRARASAAGRTAVLLHGSEIDPSPDGFRQAVAAAGFAPAGQETRADGGTVLLVDGYEQLGAIDG